jgi:hypothetical protein
MDSDPGEVMVSKRAQAKAFFISLHWSRVRTSQRRRFSRIDHETFKVPGTTTEQCAGSSSSEHSSNKHIAHLMLLYFDHQQSGDF